MTRWWCQNGLQMVSLCFSSKAARAVLLECCASASNSTPGGSTRYTHTWVVGQISRQQSGNQNLYKAFKHIWARTENVKQSSKMHWVSLSIGVEKPLDGRLMVRVGFRNLLKAKQRGKMWRPQIRRADPWYTHPLPQNFTDEKGRWLIASSPWIEGSFHPSPGSAASVHIHMFYDWGWHEGRSHAIHLASGDCLHNLTSSPTFQVYCLLLQLLHLSFLWAQKFKCTSWINLHHLNPLNEILQLQKKTHATIRLNIPLLHNNAQ